MDTITISKKVCTGCKVEKDLAYFHRDKGKVDGRQTKCKKCSGIIALKKAEGSPATSIEIGLSDHIRRKTNEGKALTRGAIAIMECVDSNTKINEESSEVKTPVYNGLPVTGDMYRNAREWLTKNGWGNPAIRLTEPEKDDRTEAQKLEEVKYGLKELADVDLIKDVCKSMGYEMVKIVALEAEE